MVLIWNWKTGVQIFVNFPPLPDTYLTHSLGHCCQDAHSYAFLSERLIVLAGKLDPKLSIIEFTCTQGSGSDAPTYTTLAEFCLPDYRWEFEGKIRILYGPTPYLAHGTSAPPYLPFTIDPNNRVYIVVIEPSGFPEQNAPTLFIPRHTFMKHLDTAPSSGLRLPQVISWDQWGPHGTRMMNFPGFGVRLYGSRCVHITGDLPSLQGVYAMYDFGLSALRRCAQAASTSRRDGNVSVQYVSSKSTIAAADEVFNEDVVTSLPYTLTTTLFPEQYRTVCMISEECIVLRGDSKYYVCTF